MSEVLLKCANTRPTVDVVSLLFSSVKLPYNAYSKGIQTKLVNLAYNIYPDQPVMTVHYLVFLFPLQLAVTEVNPKSVAVCVDI